MWNRHREIDRFRYVLPGLFRRGGGGWVSEKMFSREQYEQLRSFPEISREELFRYFTLTPADAAFVGWDRNTREMGRAAGPCWSGGCCDWSRSRSSSLTGWWTRAGRGRGMSSAGCPAPARAAKSVWACSTASGYAWAFSCRA